MKQLEEYFINKESQSVDATEKLLTMFFRKHKENYGFKVTYFNGILGVGIGLECEWPEAPDNGNYLKSSMITGYKFKQFSYGARFHEELQNICFLIFKYRNHFYINFVMLNKGGDIREAELMEFESKETMLEVAKEQLWLGVAYEVNLFLKDDK